MGGCYSAGSTEPGLDDYTLIYDYSDFETFHQWNWSGIPLIWHSMFFFCLTLDTTYCLRGYVKTDKAEYYSNTMKVSSNFTAPLEEAPDTYTISVVFHLFPDADGTYPIKEWMVSEQIAYANHVYGNYCKIPGQADTGVRFAAATHAPDGTPLPTHGIVYETEPLEIDFETVQLTQYVRC